MSKFSGFKYVPDSVGDVKLGLILGSGYTFKPYNPLIRWLRLDCSRDVKPDIVCEVGTEKIPLKDNTVSFIESHHSLEHIPNLTQAIDDLYRISKNGAIWTITVPFGYSWQDHLFHTAIGWHWNSWDKYTTRQRTYYTTTKLKLLKVTAKADGWLNWLPFKRKLSSLFNNVYREICYTLEVQK